MVIAGALFQWSSRSLAGLDVEAGQPAATAMALACCWETTFALVVAVVVVVVAVVVVVVVVALVDLLGDFLVIKKIDPTTTTARITTMIELRSKLFRRWTLAWAAILASRPARC